MILDHKYINSLITIIIPMSKKLALVAVSLLLATFALYQLNNQSATPALQKEPFDYLAVNAECTKTLEVECALDVERTVVACAKAFETGGADVIADIKCAKDLLSDKKHCWPCICSEAKKKGWHIVGC